MSARYVGAGERGTVAAEEDRRRREAVTAVRAAERRKRLGRLEMDKRVDRFSTTVDEIVDACRVLAGYG